LFLFPLLFSYRGHRGNVLFSFPFSLQPRKGSVDNFSLRLSFSRDGTIAARMMEVSRTFRIIFLASSLRPVFMRVKRESFRLNTATLFSSPTVVVDAPCFGSLACHARRPEAVLEEPSDDFREAALSLRLRTYKFALDLTEDRSVVVPFGLISRILVAPLEISAVLSSGHKVRKGIKRTLQSFYSNFTIL